MAYNYNNSYGNTPYGNYNFGNSGYQQPNYTQYQPNQTMYNQYQTPQMQQVNPQTNYLSLTFVNGIEGAKAFIVNPNQVIYLKDSDSNLIFEKKADAQGKYTLNAFEMKEVQINDIGKKNDCGANLGEDFVKRNELPNYLTLEEFSKYEIKMNNALDRLTRQIDLVVSKAPQSVVKKEG